MPEGSIINGKIVMWNDGRLEPVKPSRAWSEWLALSDSPIRPSQERAKALRSALNTIGYLQ